MGKHDTTAGKTAERTITLTIDGSRYDLLERVANAMNSVSWCSGNTPESVFDEFVSPLAEDMLDSPSDLCDFILSGIATGDEGRTAPEPKHTVRLSELRDAFAAIGIFDTIAEIHKALQETRQNHDVATHKPERRPLDAMNHK